MNNRTTRREFMVTTATAAFAAAVMPSALAAEPTGVHWPVGCFNRPWHEKADWGFDTALDGIRDSGYKLIGLLRTGANEPLTNPGASTEYLDKLKKRIASRGLKVNMTALRTQNDLPLDEQMKKMRQQIDNAVFVGAEYGLTFGVDKAKYFEDYYKLMHDASAYAKDKGFKIVLKPHGGASGAAEEITRCLQKVDHPNFKIWFDAGNIIYYTGKDPVEQLKPIAQYVTGFCAKDCDKQKGSVTLEFGKGQVDFHAVFAEMKRAGFNGPIMVECVGDSNNAAEATASARKNREFLETVFKTV